MGLTLLVKSHADKLKQDAPYEVGLTLRHTQGDCIFIHIPHAVGLTPKNELNENQIADIPHCVGLTLSLTIYQKII